MTDQDILQKAIEKTQANGYWNNEKFFIYPLSEGFNIEFRPEVSAPGIYFNHEAVIFSHDFAKAFWDEEDANDRYEVTSVKRVRISGNMSTGVDSRTNTVRPWQYHLQQMVLEYNPLRYLGRFLEPENE